MSQPPAFTAHAQRELSSSRVDSDTAIEAFEGLYAQRATGSPAWLLDSALPSSHLGRYSFAGTDPYLVLSVRGRRAELAWRRRVWPGHVLDRSPFEGDPFEIVRDLLPRPPETDSEIPFVGGAVGYFGYELAEQIEALGLGASDDLGLADLVLLFVDRSIALDHHTGRFFANALGFGSSVAEAQEGADRAVLELCAAFNDEPTRRATTAPQARRPRAPFAFFDAGTYAKAIDAAQREIAAGNVYQACLTHRFERDWPGTPWDLYLRLRRTNPAPFASFLELPEVSIISSSPERFLRLGPDRAAESRPIKGTRPRGRHPSVDVANRDGLRRSEKERAENLMIVDLVRNDLGRVCEIGSVSVPELMAIEAYASVFQMVSTITGRLRPDLDVLDLVRACFPPGSMTGAPKIAAMRILDRLEPVRRAVYSGAIGYLDVRGGADLSVAIRALLLRDGRAYIHVGGGIVADSEPPAEYRETLDKARPLLAALSLEDG